MNILVVGCGRLGSQLAETLTRYGHNVSVIDENADNFHRLRDDFNGLTVTGMPMDMSVLRSAGIEMCDAVAVVTPDDNLYITVSQIIKEFFKIQNVIARINDSAREVVFNHFGLSTVCPTNLASSAMYTALTQPFEEKQITIGTCTMSFHVRKVGSALEGKILSSLPLAKNQIITGVLHQDGSTSLYDGRQDMVLRATDKIIYTDLVD